MPKNRQKVLKKAIKTRKGEIKQLRKDTENAKKQFRKANNKLRRQDRLKECQIPKREKLGHSGPVQAIRYFFNRMRDRDLGLKHLDREAAYLRNKKEKYLQLYEQVLGTNNPIENIFLSSSSTNSQDGSNATHEGIAQPKNESKNLPWYWRLWQFFKNIILSVLYFFLRPLGLAPAEPQPPTIEAMRLHDLNNSGSSYSSKPFSPHPSSDSPATIHDDEPVTQKPKNRLKPSRV